MAKRICFLEGRWAERRRGGGGEEGKEEAENIWKEKEEQKEDEESLHEARVSSRRGRVVPGAMVGVVRILLLDFNS